MFSLVKTDLKRKFKSSVVWLLIFIMMILSYSYLKGGIERSELDAIASYHPGIVDREEYFSKPVSYYYCDSYEEYIEEYPAEGLSESYYNTEVNIHKDKEKAFNEGNEKEYMRLESFEALLYANFFSKSSGAESALFVDEICKRENNKLWDKVSGGIKYEDIDFKNTGGKGNSLAEILAVITSNIFAARYRYYLYTHSLDPIIEEYNNIGVLYNYLINIFPTVLVIVCILLNYDSVNKEVTDGSVKLILTQSTPRWKYYLSKYFTGIIITLLVVILPIFISNLYLGSQIGFKPINYPVIYDGQGIRRFKPAFNYMESKFDITAWDYTAFFRMPYKIGFEFDKLYQRNIDIVPYYKFILLSFLFTLLFVMFLVAFVQLFSALMNNKVLSLMTITGIFAASYYIFKPFLYEEHYNLCPFTMNNGARIVAGTHNVTMLTALIVLTVSTTIFLLIGVKYFSKKEI